MGQGESEGSKNKESHQSYSLRLGPPCQYVLCIPVDSLALVARGDIPRLV